MRCHIHKKEKATSMCNMCGKATCASCQVSIDSLNMCVTCANSHIQDTNNHAPQKNIGILGTISIVPFVPLGFNYLYLGHMKKAMFFIIINIVLFMTFVSPGIPTSTPWVAALYSNIYNFVTVVLRLFTFAHCLFILRKRQPIARLGSYMFVIMCFVVVFSLLFAFTMASRPATFMTASFFWTPAAMFFVPAFYLALSLGLLVGAYFVIKPAQNRNRAQATPPPVLQPQVQATPAQPADNEHTPKQKALWDLTNTLKSKIFVFKGTNIENKVIALHDTTHKIASFIDKYPHKIRGLNKFMDYYLPTTISLLDNYKHLKEQGRTGENITKATQKIEDLLQVLQNAYDNQLDALFEDKALDIDAEVNVLKNILEKEGLLSITDNLDA